MGALGVSAFVFGAIVLALGDNPLDVYESIYIGGFGSWFSWQNTLQRVATLLLTALCAALPTQLGLAVIGGEGAFVLGGLAGVEAWRPHDSQRRWTWRACWPAAWQLARWSSARPASCEPGAA